MAIDTAYAAQAEQNPLRGRGLFQNAAGQQSGSGKKEQSHGVHPGVARLHAHAGHQDRKKHKIHGSLLIVQPFYPVFLCYMAWLLVVYRQMQTRIASAGANEQLFVPDMYTLMDYCKEWFSAMDTPIMSVIYLGMALTLFLGYYAVDRMRSSKCYIPGWGMGILGLTALTGGLLSYYVTPCFLGRYIFPGFGALALFYAVGMKQISSLRVRAAVLLVFVCCFAAQYRSELKLEYDPGLQEYEAFFESNVGPEDMIMATDIHPLLLSVYHPDRQYMGYGYLPPFSPFRNTSVFTQWEQLRDVTGNIWLYGFAHRDMPDFAPYYNIEQAFRFHYMYYDFVICRLTPAEPLE